MLAPALPAASVRGRPPRWTKRQIIDGIRWRVRTGAPWRDVPAEYAPWPTLYRWFRRWQRDGTWAAVLAVLQARSAGWWAWTPRSAVRISTRRVPVVTVTGRRNRPAGWRASRTITAWAVRAAGGPPRRIWRASRVARCWRWW